MAHPLGELALLIPARDAAAPTQIAALETALAAGGATSRRVPLGPDPEGAVRRARDEGARLLVHCGGLVDLTAAIPALLDDDVVLGLFPGGAVNDYARTFGLALAPAAAASVLLSPRVMRVDVGLATAATRHGETQRHFLNNAVVGVGAAALRRGRRLRGLGRVGGLVGWWSAIASSRRSDVDVDMTFAEWHGPATQVRCDIGQFSLGGLHVSPLALPDDGAYEVQVWDGPRSLPFTLLPKMRLADHLPHPHISQWRQKQATVTSSRPLPVAVDDGHLGTTPATFTMLPGALRLKI